MRKRLYFYILVPAVLGMGLVLMMALNNQIIGVLPPGLLAAYPLFPCWPGSDGFDTGGPAPGGRNLEFFNNYMIYHVGQPVDPGIRYESENFGIVSPDLYVYRGNMTEVRMLMEYFGDARMTQQEKSLVESNLDSMMVWHGNARLLKEGPRCRLQVQYMVDQLAQPPRLNSTGVYVFHADFGLWNDKGASYDFSVISP